MFTVELVWGDWCQDIFQSFHSLVSVVQGRGNDDSVQLAVASGKDQPRHHKNIDTEGSLPGASYRSRVLVCGGSRDPNHDAVMSIKSKAPGRRAHSLRRRKGHVPQRRTITSDRWGSRRRCRVGFQWFVPRSSPMRLGAMRCLAGSRPLLPDARAQ
jgi:hypothetical protein